MPKIEHIVMASRFPSQGLLQQKPFVWIDIAYNEKKVLGLIEAVLFSLESEKNSVVNDEKTVLYCLYL